jgi:hypothetical protein
MTSPRSKAEEDLFTTTFFKSADEYLTERENAWNEKDKERDEKARVQRYINWTLAIVCFCCILCCGQAVKVWWKLGDDMEAFMRHQSMMSNRQMQLQEEKAKRDSIANAIYIKQMNHYESLPDYRRE